jgi:hypothetical protein
MNDSVIANRDRWKMREIASRGYRGPGRPPACGSHPHHGHFAEMGLN